MHREMCIHYKDEMQKMYGALIEHLEYQARPDLGHLVSHRPYVFN